MLINNKEIEIKKEETEAPVKVNVEIKGEEESEEAPVEEALKLKEGC